MNRLSLSNDPRRRRDAASARICGNGAAMFALLFLLPVLPFGEHRWLLLPWIAVSAAVFRLVLRDVLVLSRPRAESEAERSEDRRPMTMPVGPAVPAWPKPRPPVPILSIGDHRGAGAPRVDSDAEFEAWPFGVVVETVAVDGGVVALAVRVADENKMARTRIEVPIERALAFGDAFDGFPDDDLDRRDATLGSFEPTVEGGALRLVVFIRHPSTCAYVRIRPRSNAPGSALAATFTVDPEQLRSFVRGLQSSPLTEGAKVELLPEPTRGRPAPARGEW